MKYLKIELEDNKSILVDSSTKVKEGDYYNNNGHILKCDEIKIRSSCSKIIDTINHSIDRDVAMIIMEDAVETKINNAIRYWKNFGEEKQEGIAYGLGLALEFYKSFQQKGVYSEEDIINAAKYGYEFRDITSFPEHKFEDSCINNFKQKLQSLKQEYVELEMEIDVDNPPEGYYTYISSGKYHDDEPYLMKELFSNPDKEPNYKIKTDRDNGQLMAYIKK